MISALVSAYFAEDYLHQRLENLKAQTVEVEPVVVCQRASVEREICAYHGIKPIVTDGIPSIGAAWNLALQHARGEYVTTANCDDLFLDNGLELLSAVLDQQPHIGLAFSQVYKTDGNEVWLWERIPNQTGEIKGINALLKRRCIVGPMPLWRKSIHRQVGRFIEAYVVACDYEMWRRMALAGVRFYYLAQPAGVYMWRHDSLEHRNPSRLAHETQQIQEIA